MVALASLFALAQTLLPALTNSSSVNFDGTGPAKRILMPLATMAMRPPFGPSQNLISLFLSIALTPPPLVLE